MCTPFHLFLEYVVNIYSPECQPARQVVSNWCVHFQNAKVLVYPTISNQNRHYSVIKNSDTPTVTQTHYGMQILQKPEWEWTTKLSSQEDDT